MASTVAVLVDEALNQLEAERDHYRRRLAHERESHRAELAQRDETIKDQRGALRNALAKIRQLEMTAGDQLRAHDAEIAKLQRRHAAEQEEARALVRLAEEERDREVQKRRQAEARAMQREQEAAAVLQREQEEHGDRQCELNAQLREAEQVKEAVEAERDEANSRAIRYRRRAQNAERERDGQRDKLRLVEEQLAEAKDRRCGECGGSYLHHWEKGHEAAG